ncbi:hypothetical protein MCOR27_008860 [Pyricularia oryzae]|uniref:Uncharacterized protein n=5 Tax=Pyricularia TaxID=48558 RepID=G5EH64_PYRO7|nr:uncharacterized protein MGG_17917 [Pyricularia oryzae 70-15]ELQ41550.1 hypothetical protein OOU_Y34scaffold00272g2 [Pyricularia oryzae Y34]KAH8838489.1 hypothetical protein MCOR01_009926 [Pyricularia oryzae]KAI6290035.1 hypothetical protein MCOR33_011572 [Pyricularia grisea]EAQ71292.1 hypothetical protein MGCH7_ch7g699 [Pyricularia oryzae 70-15]EHA46038.1 hypothetical protein MGG_17917 [Pyricularia oryzae 70-15]
MCTYQYMEYSCGHCRTIVSEWCSRYRGALQSHIRCRPEIRYHTTNDSLCSYCKEQQMPKPAWMPPKPQEGSRTYVGLYKAR